MGRTFSRSPGVSRLPGKCWAPNPSIQGPGLSPAPLSLSLEEPVAQGLPWPVQGSCQLSHCSPQDHQHATTDSCDPHNLEGSWAKYHSTHMRKQEICPTSHVSYMSEPKAPSPGSQSSSHSLNLTPHLLWPRRKAPRRRGHLGTEMP